MFTTLPESRRRRQRSAASTLVSIAAHAAVVGAVAAATAAGKPAPPPPPAAPVDIVYRQPVDPPAPAERLQLDRRAAPCDCPPGAPVPAPPVATVAFPGDVPIGLPPTDFPLGAVFDVRRVPMASGGARDGAGGGGGATSGDGGVLRGEYADRPAVARPGNPEPRYPDLLRRAGVEGSVRLAFVIDTLGRVAPGRVTVVHSDHALFTDAVRAVLSHMRFLPAEVNRRRVPVLVQQAFEFRLVR